MAFKQIGTPKFATGINVDITIDGCTIFTSASVSKGYSNITEIKGHDGEVEAVVMAGQHTYDVTVNGYVDEGGEIPANGDDCTVKGYKFAWIDGVSISETPDGVTTFSATVHARGEKKTTTS